MLDTRVQADGPRVLEVLIEHMDVGAEGVAFGRRQQLAVRRGRSQDRRQLAGPEEGLPARAVCRAGAGQVQPGYAGVVDPRARPKKGLAVAVCVVGQAYPRLQHIQVGWDSAVGWEPVGARVVGHGFADEIAEEDGGRIGDRVGLNLRLPAHAVVDRQPVGNQPTVLHEQCQFVLRNSLGARFLHGQPAHAGLFQVEQDRSGDLRALGAYPLRR